MRAYLVAAVASAVLSGAIAASAVSMPGQALIDIEAKWAKALVAKDAKTIATIMADDFAGQGQSGKVSSKTSSLADITSGKLVVRSMTNHDVHVRIIGDVAIVQGMDDEDSSYDGKAFKGTYSWTDIYAKRGGQWLAVASQGTPVDKKK